MPVSNSSLVIEVNAPRSPTTHDPHLDRWQTPTVLHKYLVATYPDVSRNESGGSEDGSSEREAVDLLTTTIKGYEGFGSFHSQNVEELVALPDDKYVAPAWPKLQWMCPRHHDHHIELSHAIYHPNAIISASGKVWDIATLPADSAQTEFGQPFLQEHFMIAKDFVFINHGAFGGSLLGAQSLKEHMDRYMESQILRFYDRELLPLIVYVVRALSKFIHCNPKNLVLVQNATSGLNAAIRHLIKPNDVVAYLDTEYLSVYKMAYIRAQEVGATLHEIPLNMHLHDDALLSDDDALTKHIVSHLPPGCTTAIIDFVTSTTAMLMPTFTHLVPALRAAGVKRVIVDGAHTSLQVPLDFNALPVVCQPDAFVGNLHKWFSCPKAAAFMWIKDENIRVIEPAVISHGAREGLLSSFIWDGTRDYSAYLTIPAIIHFWELQGLDRVREYCSTLLRDAVTMLTTAFQTRRIARHAPFMSLVELPEALQGRRDASKYVQDVLHTQYRIEVPVKQIESTLYLRISVFVYNEPAHYAFLRDAILDFVERIRKRPRDDGTPCPTQHVGGCGVTASQTKMAGF
ncbi:aminotransferase, putative [Bodo saltans]|uniref:Aminotransferase, putative n=1 Tax=Bodo saltans TaxID=75058 RepID=A0A0S4ISZ5_BODSA|nr:aminotransferase, putative [Bodo saltans]|eukprot:CUF67861.1 aminotransferase, putative [Bodo saltans]